MKICVLQPDYSTSDVDYKSYDPPRDLSPYLPGDTVDHVFLNKLHTYKRLKELSHKDYDIFVNLCEGYLDWAVPSIDVPYFLEMLQLPYTGPDTRVYDPSKELMKYVAYTVDVDTPSYAVLHCEDVITAGIKDLSFPLFVKPAKAGDSLGIDYDSLVTNPAQLATKVSSLFKEYDEVLVEEYIEGREFTVLVVALAGRKDCHAYNPVEYIFPDSCHFKTYSLKTKELHPNANIPCTDLALGESLKKAAKDIFKGFEGVGYARLDFRLNSEGRIFFLEINFTCSVFYTNGYEGSADYILKFEPEGAAGFLRKIIEEGISRYTLRHKCYKVKGNAISGYGLSATRSIPVNAIIFEGEGKAQRVISRAFIEKHWTPSEQLAFRRYAYPVGRDVFLLWDLDPGEWAPQNHSCDPNTRFDGLNVIATKDITPGQELTLDYVTFLDSNMEPFNCNCASEKCRGRIEFFN